MIKLEIEAAIDLDINRKIWISGSAVVEDETVENGDLPAVVAALSENVTAQAIGTYEKAIPQVKLSRPEGVGADPRREPLETFGDD